MKLNSILFLKFSLSLLLFLLFETEIVVGQTSFVEVEPSVNAQQFLSPHSSENSLQTGQFSFNIPLFNLESQGVDVPVLLSFNGGSVSNESEASHIGLGWSLMAGGVITQVIRDKNDENTTTSNNIPWQNQQNYLQAKWQEQEMNIYTNNLFDQAMSQVIGFDGEPDIFKYSFQGYSGNIKYLKNSSGDVSGTLYPDKSFKIEKLQEGFKIVTNDAVEYLFTAKEVLVSGSGQISTSWFLKEIRTLQGGNVIFHYVDEYSYNLSDKISASSYSHYISKRLSRIDYDYGYVVLSSSIRNDMYFNGGSSDAKRIVNVEMFNNEGLLIKGFEFGNTSYFSNADPTGSNFHNLRLKLDSVKEYGPNGFFKPPYVFTYDSYFGLAKTSTAQINNFPLPKTSWATNPGSLAVVDRDLNGNVSPRIQITCISPPGYPQVCIPSIIGFETFQDPSAGSTLSDFLCLTKVVFPTGGYETYSYSRHDYSFYPNSTDTISPNEYFSQNSSIRGKRLQNKIIVDNTGNVQIVEYQYFLHDNNYGLVREGTKAISSGVLVNPAVLSTTMYKPTSELSTARLHASRHATNEPQNGQMGSAVYYSEVEEVYRTGLGLTNGKNIYFFEKMYSIPAENYVYLNYSRDGSYFTKDNRLISLPNTKYGKEDGYQYLDPLVAGLSDQYFTYLAYPLGRFYLSELRAGRILKEVTLNSNGNVVREILNEYTPADGLESTIYGLLVKKFDDNDYSANPNPSFEVNRYLISKTKVSFGTVRLLKKTITDYHPTGTLIKENAFTYNPLNLLKSSSISGSEGVPFSTHYNYVNDVLFETQSGLSDQALSIKAMKELNMIGTPLQTSFKKGTILTGGNYSSYKLLPNGIVVADTVFSLEVPSVGNVAIPFVNNTGQVERNSNFQEQKVFISYDENINPEQIIGTEGILKSIIWGYVGQYPIAEISNAEINQVSYSSFETTDKGGWSYSGAPITTYKTGKKGYNLSSGSVTKTGISASSSSPYRVGFWAKTVSGTGSVNVGGQSESLTTVWKWVEKNITTTSLTISGSNIIIDELRLHPEDAMMTSYTYKPLVGMTSRTDPRGYTVTYVYDTANRLQTVKDEDGNILEHYEYNYATGN
ncbi:YD repeat-containing protein [Algoriphagus locisalis]|uniref:YD repeat-containing protein n=1 Tax=Algoriphagus locisalis TaxID=305507 RepID=A0A1I7CBL9_9BACT|nr:RHS repeat domain-containing protein [Algoriphagus locisalis]SFT96821.1 YD repeat-containing protein [Algoriphagus locisalis]